jgi:hypothetical protein
MPVDTRRRERLALHLWAVDFERRTGWVSLAVFPGLLVPFIDITVSSRRVSINCFIPCGIADPWGIRVGLLTRYLLTVAPLPHYCVLVWGDVDGGSYLQAVCRVPEGEGLLLIEYIKVRQCEVNFSASEAREMR